jgi:hypothetical protein
MDRPFDVLMKMSTAPMREVSSPRIRYHEFPAWVRIPLQYLLPLNLRFSSEISSGRSPIYYGTAGIDVLY